MQSHPATRALYCVEQQLPIKLSRLKLTSNLASNLQNDAKIEEARYTHQSIASYLFQAVGCVCSRVPQSRDAAIRW